MGNPDNVVAAGSSQGGAVDGGQGTAVKGGWRGCEGRGPGRGGSDSWPRLWCGSAIGERI